MPLTVVTGPMYAEKSTTLYRYVSRALRSKKRVDVVVPKIDTRSKGQVVTHSGLTLESLDVKPRVVTSSADLYRAMPTPAPDLMATMAKPMKAVPMPPLPPEKEDL
jgi:thymidine kinase